MDLGRYNICLSTVAAFTGLPYNTALPDRVFLRGHLAKKYLNMSKKKQLFARCDRCGVHLLSSHLPKHPSNCEREPTTPFIEVGKRIGALSTKVDTRKDCLPSSGIGWHRSNTVLLSSQALDLAGVLPRTPCYVREGDNTSLAVTWPSSEVSGLKISVDGLPGERFVEITFVEQLVDLHEVILKPITPIAEELLEAPHFALFIQVYLAGSYLATDVPVVVNYLARTYKFELFLSLTESLSGLKLDGINQSVFVVKDGATVTFPSSTVASEKLRPHSADPFEKIGGAKEVKDKLMQHVIDPVRKGLPVLSIILYGFTGCGKSLFASAIEQKLGERGIRITSLKKFNEVRTALSQSVLILDFVVPQSDQASTSSAICDLMDARTCTIVLITDSIDKLDLRVRRRFNVELEVMVPSTEEREQIFEIYLSAIFKGRAQELARDSHGFTGSDIESMCRLAELLSSEGNKEPLIEARKATNPTGIRQFILEVPNVSWDSIGGNDDLKQEIKQAVIWPYEHPEAFERLGVQPPNGILLYGPPGCSKTLIARALASQSKLNFLSVKGPELFSKWVGESEKAVRDLFHRARQVSPAILFFDEIDAIAPKRGNDKSSAVSDRVLAQMLTELDGLEKSARIFVVAATNRPDTLDGALLRPGRLDRSIYVPLPDYQTRKSIIDIQFRQIKVSDDVDVDQVAQLSEGYSGAELVALCRNAALCAMRDDIQAVEVRAKHFGQSFKMVLPRTDPNLLRLYERFAKGEV